MHGDVVLEVLQLLDAECKVVVLEDLVAHADDLVRVRVRVRVRVWGRVRGRVRVRVRVRVSGQWSVVSGKGK